MSELITTIKRKLQMQYRHLLSEKVAQTIALKEDVLLMQHGNKAMTG